MLEDLLMNQNLQPMAQQQQMTPLIRLLMQNQQSQQQQQRNPLLGGLGPVMPQPVNDIPPMDEPRPLNPSFPTIGQVQRIEPPRSLAAGSSPLSASPYMMNTVPMPQMFEGQDRRNLRHARQNLIQDLLGTY